MSALPKSQIISRLRSRSLWVSPILSDRQIGSCTIDLRLGTIAMLVRARGLSHVDPRAYRDSETGAVDAAHHASEKGRQQKFERCEVPFNESLLLHPGNLVLVPTLEWIKMPADLQGVVTARSSWAREGLSIATATFIDPGYNGIVTLELANLGEIPIRLSPGLRIAQIAFYELKTKNNDAPIASQFNLAFEPTAGRLVTGDEHFLPRPEGDEIRAESKDPRPNTQRKTAKRRRRR